MQDAGANDVNADASSTSIYTAEFWVDNRDKLEATLLAKFQAWALSFSSPVIPSLLKIQDPAPPYTKVRLQFISQRAAHQAMLHCRMRKLTPAQLLQVPTPAGEEESSSTISFAALLERGGVSHRPLQISEITTRPLPADWPSWTRSNPPKFRRLMARPDEDGAEIKRERQTTRFLVFTNLLADPNAAGGCWEDDAHSIVHAVRAVVTPYDRSGCGVEVFIPNQINKRSRYFHVGMRSAADAQAVLAALQEQVVDWPHRDADGNVTARRSGKLFIDYAATTQRSEERAATRDAGLGEEERGLPARPQCTSTTDHIRIPGLVLIPDYLSEDEEAALMAVLTGPQAPWAPSQRTASHADAVVRRAVQHYGYVFDYQTADVVRNRSLPGGDCPPMPAVPAELLAEESDASEVRRLDGYIEACLDEGRGWEVLAGVLARTRRFSFPDNVHCRQCAAATCFPDLNQLTVNQYVPGEGIGSHVDTPSAFSDGLLSISLNGGIVMEFRNVDDKDSKNGVKKLVYLPPRSLLLMSRDARFKWEHMIVSRMTDTHNSEVLKRKLRVSLTLRSALSDDGVSPMPLVESPTFPPTWGDRTLGSTPLSHLATPDCERNHVHAVYDAIATQWHHTRGKRGVLWPGATQFLQRLPPGSIVADAGCGDGKYFPAIWEAGSYVIGTDVSEPLLRTAMHDNRSNDVDVPETRRVSERRHHLRNRPAVAVADCMNIPLRTNSCDAAICVAVLHHLSTQARRKRCIEELVRVVKPEGFVYLQAWALEQEDGSRRKFASNDLFVPFYAQPKYLQMNVSPADAEGKGSTTQPNETNKSTAQVYSEALNAEYDDRKGLVVFKRYCHMFRLGELDEIALSVPGVVVVASGFENGNYFIIFEVRKGRD